MVSLTDAVVVLLGGPSNTDEPGVLWGSGAPVEARAVLASLKTAVRGGAKVAVLVGGEPTTRRDLKGLLGAARKLGLAPGLATNGRMLVYPQLRRLLVDAGVAYVRVALHGAIAAVHDAVVGVEGAHAQTLEGLGLLLEEAPDTTRIDVACTVTAANAAELEDLAAIVAALPRRATLSLRFVAPLETLEEDAQLSGDRVTERVGSALERAVTAAGSGVGVGWEGFPPCLLDAHAHLRDETLRYGVLVHGPRSVGASIPLEDPDHGREHPYPCQECVHQPTCPGAPTDFVSCWGESVLRPTKALRANSYNYELDRTLAEQTIAAGACSVPSLEIDGPTQRALVLVTNDAATLYRSPTGDFTDAEVATVKDDLGQVYVDVTDGAALDDFTASIRRVTPHAECPACPDRPRCPAAYVVDPDPPFVREERWLKKEVSRMRGRVLDVGCGEQPYRELVAGLIADGHIEYVGVDPDGPALERIKESGMGGDLHHGTIEDFEWEAGWFDYVLGLRSLNHFEDMERAFTVICRLMRVEGQLVLCDSPPFAMLRTPDQVRFADENAPVGHEHYRNWTSQQVVQFLERFPLRVDVHRPVTRKTSNQWIVKLMRVAETAP